MGGAQRRLAESKPAWRHGRASARALANYGVTLGVLENVETFGNLSGGVRQGFEANGLTTVTLQMDTGKAFGLKGGTLNASGLQYWGGNLTADNLMVLQTLTDIEAPVGVRLWELWYQQKFTDRFDIKIGEQSLDEEFTIAPTANAFFVSAASGWPGVPTIDLPGGGPAYPLAGLGVRGRAQLTDSVTLLAGVFNGSPIPRNSPNAPQSNPHGVSFPLDTGVLAIAELQLCLRLRARPESPAPTARCRASTKSAPGGTAINSTISNTIRWARLSPVPRATARRPGATATFPYMASWTRWSGVRRTIPAAA